MWLATSHCTLSRKQSAVIKRPYKILFMKCLWWSSDGRSVCGWHCAGDTAPVGDTAVVVFFDGGPQSVVPAVLSTTWMLWSVWLEGELDSLESAISFCVHCFSSCHCEQVEKVRSIEMVCLGVWERLSVKWQLVVNVAFSSCQVQRYIGTFISLFTVNLEKKSVSMWILRCVCIHWLGSSGQAQSYKQNKKRGHS